MLSRRAAGGFTLVELMVAIVAGLIVIGSAITFAVSTIRAYNENIRSTRLTQDLRSAMTVVVREVRRAGYDSKAPDLLFSDEFNTPSTEVSVAAGRDCIAYTYDVAGTGVQQRAFRLNTVTGTLQAKQGATAACGDENGWEDLTDARVVAITRMRLDERPVRFCGEAGRVASSTPGQEEVTKITGTVRNFAICIDGQLRNDPGVVRTQVDSSRMRAEHVTSELMDVPANNPVCLAADSAFSPALSPATMLNADGNCS